MGSIHSDGGNTYFVSRTFSSSYHHHLLVVGFHTLCKSQLILRATTWHPRDPDPHVPLTFSIDLVMSKHIELPSGPLAPPDNPSPASPALPGKFYQYPLVDLVDPTTGRIREGDTSAGVPPGTTDDIISPNELKAMQTANLRANVQQAVRQKSLTSGMKMAIRQAFREEIKRTNPTPSVSSGVDHLIEACPESLFAGPSPILHQSGSSSPASPMVIKLIETREDTLHPPISALQATQPYLLRPGQPQSVHSSSQLGLPSDLDPGHALSSDAPEVSNLDTKAPNTHIIPFWAESTE